MKNFFGKIKLVVATVFGVLASFLLRGAVKAQSYDNTLYGINSGNSGLVSAMYGPRPPMPEPITKTLLQPLLAIGALAIIFVIVPFVGMIMGTVWYYKHGGQKKWPGIAVKIIVGLAIVSIIAALLVPYLQRVSII